MTAVPKPVRSLAAPELQRLRTRACALGQRCVTLDCTPFDAVDDVLRGLGQALALPGYYGANFDALYDCLTDLDAGAPGLVLLIENLPVGQRCTARHLATLRKVLRDAAAALAEQGRVLEVGYSVRAPQGGRVGAGPR